MTKKSTSVPLVSPQLVLLEIFIFRDVGIKPEILSILSLQNALNKNLFILNLLLQGCLVSLSRGFADMLQENTVMLMNGYLQYHWLTF